MINLQYKVGLLAPNTTHVKQSGTSVLSAVNFLRPVAAVSQASSNLKLYQTLSDYFFSPGHSGLGTKSSK